MWRTVPNLLNSVFFCGLLCIQACGCGTKNGGGDSDGKALDIVGVWDVQPDGKGDGPGFTYEFTATEMTIKDKGNVVMAGTYKIDESKRPRIITYRMTKNAPDTTVERQINLFMGELSIGTGDNLVKLKRRSK